MRVPLKWKKSLLCVAFLKMWNKNEVFKARKILEIPHRNETRSLAIADWIWYSAGE